ncbi:MAG: fabG [Chlamydiales bacterium]|nr:fabG [Chlamydiales bacterium]
MMNDNKVLQNKLALITGGNVGIGKAIALAYAQAGANVALFGTNAERGLETVQEIDRLTNKQVNARFYAVDISQKPLVEEAIVTVAREMGDLSIIVNNAGITRDNLLLKMSEKDWDDVLTTNLKSVYNTCHAVIRPMIKARQGVIINISSVVGLIGNAGQTNYAAAKAGMIGFSQSLAKEVASRNIRVNCIAPGFIETKMTDALSEEQKDLWKKGIPMGRFGKPEEIAHMAVFLASDMATYITGQVFAVDGGMTM